MFKTSSFKHLRFYKPLKTSDFSKPLVKNLYKRQFLSWILVTYTKSTQVMSEIYNIKEPHHLIQTKTGMCAMSSWVWVSVCGFLLCIIHKFPGVNILHNQGKLFPDGVFSWDKLFPRIMRNSRHFLKLIYLLFSPKSTLQFNFALV